MKRREIILTGITAAAACAIPSVGVAQSAGSNLTPPVGRRLSVAFVIGENANLMDLAGPWETLQDVIVKGDSPFDLATVSDRKDPVAVAGRIPVTPNYTYADAPQPDIIIMGAQGEHTSKKIAWIQSAGAKADLVTSVCTGAFLLAKTGLLDGLRATTHHEFYDKFERQFPNVHLVRGPRYVENGKTMSAGGLTSGIELALRIVQRYHGAEAVKQTALYMEYARSLKRPTG